MNDNNIGGLDWREERVTHQGETKRFWHFDGHLLSATIREYSSFEYGIFVRRHNIHGEITASHLSNATSLEQAMELAEEKLGDFANQLWIDKHPKP